MKQCVFIYFFFIFFAPYAFAIGTTTLTTYYPPPTAAYKQVNLSNNYITNAPTGTALSFCTATSTIGMTYLDTSNNNTLYVCTNIDASSPANGTIHSDNMGTLHVVMNGQDVTYPQECYNKFCSYTGASCLPTCPSGFNLMPVDYNSGIPHYSDSFQTSPTTTVVSIVCCTSSYNASASVSSTGNPPDESSTPP